MGTFLLRARLTRRLDFKYGVDYQRRANRQALHSIDQSNVASLYLLSEPDTVELRLVSRIQYDAARHAFRIPLLLSPNQTVAFTLTGFRSAAGAPGAPIKLSYQVSGEELAKADREKMNASAAEPRLLKLLATMKQSRTQLTSIAEHVQTLLLFQKDGVFCVLRSQGSTFKWQQPDVFYVDATDSVNVPLPAGNFAVPKLGGLPPVPEFLDADYTNRFVNLSDGSDGNMTIRYGKEGPKGNSGGGFIMDGY